MMKIRIILISLLLLFVSCAQPEIEFFGSISGIVKDIQTNEVLQNVKVTMSPGGESQLTGGDGLFSFEELEQTEYTISFVKDGYNDESQKVVVKPGMSSSVQISMMPVLPELHVSTNLLDFNEQLSTLSVDITNTGKGELLWNVVENIDWLEASACEGTISRGTSSVVFTIDRSDLEEGNHMNSFVISSNGGSVTIVVMVSVVAIQFEVSPMIMDFSTVQNEMMLTISNKGNRSFEWHAKTANDWVKLSKNSGLLSKEDYVNIVISRENLSPGKYTSEIVFNAESGRVSVPILMEVAVNEKPTVTAERAEATYNGAVLYGTVVSVGSDKITRHGFCWGESENPTIEDNFSNLGDCSGPKAFESIVRNLKSETVYYYRAYAENAAGLSYSDKIHSFMTAGLPRIPEVSTISIADVTSTTASVKGSIRSLGNVEKLAAYGHVWSTEPGPTIDNGALTNHGETTSASSYVSNLTGLQAATNYYIRSYATNEKGTAYGEELVFETLKEEVKLVTSEVRDIIHNAATVAGKILYSGGHKIVERGVCWDVKAMPTIEESHVISDMSSDEYLCRISGLNMETSYYVRAYVKTEDDIVFYGSDIKFTTTKEVKLPQLSAVSISEISISSATFSAEIEDKGNSEITECGFCWSSVAEPTIEDNKVCCDTQEMILTKKMKSLREGTRYYVRAFAKNAMGIAYGEIGTFETIAIREPSLDVVSVSDISTSGATFVSRVLDNGGAEITECGFCWSDSSNPTVRDNIIPCDPESWEMGKNVVDLVDGTKYYVRSYAVNTKGVSYSEVVEFETLQIIKPSLGSLSISAIGRSTANVSSSIISNGNSEITEYGFCWNISPAPTVYDNKVLCEYSVFNAKLTELPYLTTIYVRAYAMNEKGTSYSEEECFVTLDIDVWDGTTAGKFAGGVGTVSDPILISSANQLKLLSHNVNEGTTYSGVYFKLTSSMSLANIEWTPIGNSNRAFGGVIDGDGYEITDLIITTSSSYSGLVGNNSGTLINIKVSGTVYGGESSAGICGNNTGSIEKCINNVLVLSSNGGVAGVCGRSTGTIIGCRNLANIEGGDCCGGIVGSGVASNCVNEASIKGRNGVGGIVGACELESYNSLVRSINNCMNRGSVMGVGNVGGIVGSSHIIAKCDNTGPDTIVSLGINNCSNLGQIVGETYAGGICGNVYVAGAYYHGNGGYSDYPGNQGQIGINNCVNTNINGLIGNLSFGNSYPTHSSYYQSVFWDYSNSYYLYDISNNIGQENPIGTESGSGNYYTRSAVGCYLKGNKSNDIVDLLNTGAQSNSTYLNWKYELIDGYVCPVLVFE